MHKLHLLQDTSIIAIWCDTELYDLSKDVKEGKGYGQSADAFMDFKGSNRRELQAIEAEKMMEQVDNLLNQKNTTGLTWEEAIIGLLEIKEKFGRTKMSYIDINGLVTEAFQKELQLKKIRLRYEKIKEIEQIWKRGTRKKARSSRP